MRKAVRGDRELDRRVGAAAFGQHAEHAADRIAIAARLLHDLDDREVAVLCRPGRLAGHHDPMTDAPVVRHDEADTALEREPARDLARAPLEHLDDRAFRASALVAAGHARGRAIAVEEHPHLTVRQEEIVTTVVRREEAEAVAMSAHGADDDRQAFDQAVLVRAIDEQLSVARHRAETFRDRLAFRRLANAEERGERVEAQRFLRFGEFREQEFAARNRLGIARRFLLETRILLLPARLAAHVSFSNEIKRAPSAAGRLRQVGSDGTKADYSVRIRGARCAPSIARRHGRFPADVSHRIGSSPPLLLCLRGSQAPCVLAKP